jgi:hypothetical protein
MNRMMKNRLERIATLDDGGHELVVTFKVRDEHLEQDEMRCRAFLAEAGHPEIREKDLLILLKIIGEGVSQSVVSVTSPLLQGEGKPYGED